MGGKRCTHPYSAATQATGVAGQQPQQPQQRHASPGTGSGCKKGGGRRRGGERRPRARSGPGGGGRLRPYSELIHKVPPYATTRGGFPATDGESATGTRCSVSPMNYNIC